MDWFKIGKGVWQGCTLSPYLINLHAEYIMRNVRLDERQAEISITSDMQRRSPYGRKQRRTKEPLDESKRGE